MAVVDNGSAMLLQGSYGHGGLAMMVAASIATAWRAATSTMTVRAMLMLAERAATTIIAMARAMAMPHMAMQRWQLSDGNIHQACVSIGCSP